MATNFQKTKELLEDIKGPTATAIKSLAMDLDNKFDELDGRIAELDTKNDHRHEEILEAIKNANVTTETKLDCYKTATDAKFETLKVFMAISENWRLIVTIVVIVLIVIGFAKSEEIKQWLSLIL